MLYGPDLAAALKAGQLVVSTQRPPSPSKAGPRCGDPLYLLRIYVPMAIPIVCYAFIHSIMAPVH